MVGNNHKEQEKIHWKNIEERMNSKGTSGSVGLETTTEIPWPEQLHPKTQGNIKLEARANKIKPLMDIGLDDIRFQRGCCIASKKNQIEEMDRSRYSVKSQSNCGEYDVFSTEVGWLCSCADHRFRDVICKHIFAVLSMLSVEREIDEQEHEEEINESPTEEVNQERIPLTEEKEMNQSPPIQIADYEQELYEKDQYVQKLENEIRGLKGQAHCLREKIL
jgi:hypothetical protein